MKVLVTRLLPSQGPALLAQEGLEVDYREEDAPFPRKELLERVKGVDAILCTMTERIDAELMDAAGPSLKMVAIMAIGYDSIDAAEANRRCIAVTNTPDTTTIATADLTWTLILSILRRVVEGDRLAREGNWRGWGPMQLWGGDLHGNTLGIVGAGAIGTAVAQRALGFGMKIIYFSRSQSAQMEAAIPGAERVDFDTLLGRSDIVSLHLPYSSETHHLIGAAQFAAMKSSAHFINAARGPIHNEEALVDALKSGQIAGAGLDVYEKEPQIHPDLPNLSNVVLLPHLGSATERTRQSMSLRAARNIAAFAKGETPKDLVKECL